MSTSVWLQKQTLYMTCSNQPQIRDALDKDLFAWGVFEDLRKIFDTVSHSILISKLEYYSVHGIPIVWFKSYLQIRFQYISVDGTDSELLLIKHQVLQGSILGSILFLTIYTRQTFPKICHFAGETNFLYENPSLKDISRRINYDMHINYILGQNLNCWLEDVYSLLVVEKYNTQTSIYSFFLFSRKFHKCY